MRRRHVVWVFNFFNTPEPCTVHRETIGAVQVITMHSCIPCAHPSCCKCNDKQNSACKRYLFMICKEPVWTLQTECKVKDTIWPHHPCVITTCNLHYPYKCFITHTKLRYIFFCMSLKGTRQTCTPFKMWWHLSTTLYGPKTPQHLYWYMCLRQNVLEWMHTDTLYPMSPWPEKVWNYDCLLTRN